MNQDSPRDPQLHLLRAHLHLTEGLQTVEALLAADFALETPVIRSAILASLDAADALAALLRTAT